MLLSSSAGETIIYVKVTLEVLSPALKVLYTQQSKPMKKYSAHFKIVYRISYSLFFLFCALKMLKILVRDKKFQQNYV